MRSLLNLFPETRQDIDKNHADRMSRRYRYLPHDCVDRLPVLQYPAENTAEFMSDIKEVIRCHNHPCMNTKFLKSADNSVEDVFKDFCKENGFNNIDWKKIKDAIHDVDSIVLKLKYKNGRPRPIHYLQDVDDSLEVKYKKSPSFPSGHTAIAYFICDIVSKAIPELKQDLQTLASLIGQSRIENAVHYPTDIEYGRLIGETLADIFNNEKSSNIDKQLSKKHYKKFGDKLTTKNKNYKDTCHDLAYFLKRTSEIENFHVDYDECFEAAKYLMMGVPPKNITSCPHINSQIDGLVMANRLGRIDNNHKVCHIHKCFNKNILEKGAPGEFRNFSHRSPSGCQYPEPYDLNQKLRNSHQHHNHPWLRHVLYEYVHPFCDGNGRSGRIILASDCDFDFARVNDMIGEDYIDNIVAYMLPDKLNKLL
jgi:acid phosphatase (class A)|tara:strand:- start:1075 stop:2343 length:1269 start_codon:yes stop_codon:yes gene_type:complete